MLDFFNSRVDAQRMDGEWSVEKVLQVIIINCRSWRGDGMKVKEMEKAFKISPVYIGNINWRIDIPLFLQSLLF